MRTIQSRITFLLSLLALALVLGSPTSVKAQTTVSGAISTNTNWALVDSPFILNGNITVNLGVTLTIDPGVVVKMGSFEQFVVNGTINASGTEMNPIVFTSEKDDTAGGDSNGDGNSTTPAKGGLGGSGFHFFQPQQCAGSCRNSICKERIESGYVFVHGFQQHH